MRLTSFVMLSMLYLLPELTLACQPCPPGQVKTACQGHCPPACRDEDRVCTFQCVPGCICANGNVFDYTGRCIQRRQCCAKGFVETQCGANCPRTCADPNGTRPCTEQCVRGCVCAPGTVLNPAGQCVPPSQCCSTGLVWTECGAKCSPTCADPNATRPCTKECVSGCICARGTVYRRDGYCVPINRCPRSK